MGRYKISFEARKDLEKIWVYTVKSWSVEQADRYLNQIFEEIELIACKPENGTDYGGIRKGYFRTKIKLHFIFYKIENTTKTVEVIRVLHEKMDIENKLK